MSLIPLGILSSSGGAAAGAMELISTAYGTGASSSISFTSIPATFKHLQIRMVGVIPTNAGTYFYLTPNSDTSSDKANHLLYGNGSSVTSTFNGVGNTKIILSSTMHTSTYPYAAIIDILDYANTNKNKTIRSLGGTHAGANGQEITLSSGAYLSTSAITSLSIDQRYSTIYWTTATRVSLYGIKG